MHHAYLDKYANGDSFFHRLDSRVKFLAAVIYSIEVLSLPRDVFAAVACYAVAPFAVLVLAGIPMRFVCRRILVVCPFVLVLALSCPLYDKTTYTLSFGAKEFPMTIGWLRCFSIMGKFVVTMLVLFATVCTTRFADLLAGLEKMKLPRILVMQLSMLYRYLFVLVDRIHHILRARSTRKLRNLGFRQETRIAAAMIGGLFIRSVETSQKIQMAMQARGFTGTFHSFRQLRVGWRDGVFGIVFLAVWVVFHFLLRQLMTQPA